MEVQLLEKSIRKQKDKLASTGYGIMIFVLWNLLKTFIYIYTIYPSLEIEIKNSSNLIFAILLFSFEAVLSLLVGIKAIKESKKSNMKGPSLKILAIILIILASFYIAFDFHVLISTKEFDLIMTLATIIDAFFLGLTIQTAKSSFLLFKYYRLLEETK